MDLQETLQKSRPETNGADSAESGDSPVFIVGLSRSGTSMMRSILNRLEPIWITGETHYFDDLRTRFGGRKELTAQERKVCEDYFLALSHKTYGRGGDPDSGRVDRVELQQEVARLGGGLDGYFEAYCRIGARSKGRTRWGEKTPRHVFRINEMFAQYPDAKLICMVRDPRAVLSSYESWTKRGPLADPSYAADRKRAEQSYNVVILSLLWRSAVRATMQALSRFGPQRIYVQRYEELVTDPEEEVKKIADWLGVAYSPAIFEIPVIDSSFPTSERAGIKTTSLERWRERLTPSEISVVQMCCGKFLGDAGYERERTNAPLLRVIWTWLGVPVAFVRALAANRKRLGNPVAYLWRRLSLVVSPPKVGRGAGGGRFRP